MTDQQNTGNGLAVLSAIVAIATALLTLSVLAGVWNYSTVGANLLIGTSGGALAVALASLSRRGGGNVLSLVAMAIGIVTVAVGLLLLFSGGQQVEFG